VFPARPGASVSGTYSEGRYSANAGVGLGIGWGATATVGFGGEILSWPGSASNNGGQSSD